MKLDPLGMAVEVVDVLLTTSRAAFTVPLRGRVARAWRGVVTCVPPLVDNRRMRRGPSDQPYVEASPDPPEDLSRLANRAIITDVRLENGVIGCVNPTIAQQY